MKRGMWGLVASVFLAAAATGCAGGGSVWIVNGRPQGGGGGGAPACPDLSRGTQTFETVRAEAFWRLTVTEEPGSETAVTNIAFSMLAFDETPPAEPSALGGYVLTTSVSDSGLPLMVHSSGLWYATYDTYGDWKCRRVSHEGAFYRTWGDQFIDEFWVDGGSGGSIVPSGTVTLRGMLVATGAGAPEGLDGTVVTAVEAFGGAAIELDFYSGDYTYELVAVVGAGASSATLYTDNMETTLGTREGGPFGAYVPAWSPGTLELVVLPDVTVTTNAGTVATNWVELTGPTTNLLVLVPGGTNALAFTNGWLHSVSGVP